MSESQHPKLRRDAMQIWHAAVDAVRSDRLVRDVVLVDGDTLILAGEPYALVPGSRIVVVGAGKAGAGMAAGLEEALDHQYMAATKLSGWINVPADCLKPLSRIHLHPARPAGVNEPTPEGAQGAAEIMREVSTLGQNDLCISLISGGGSALLPLPIEGISLDDKLDVTRFLSAAGAPIDELNTVRKQLSRIKGGGLARACRAGRLVTLIISDVLGDPLDIIASGPTVEDTSTPEDALRILEHYRAAEQGISARVFAALQQRQNAPIEPVRCHVVNRVIGNNALAVQAAAEAAGRRGYNVRSESASASEGAAEPIGRELADRALSMQAGSTEYDCFISGGEPTVKLIAAEKRGKGGRNQQLVLAAAARLSATMSPGIVILSGGTDGEDGPTDAAGALVDAEILEAAKQRNLDPEGFLSANDAYHWFDPLGGLLKTGPTHTNVCDVRVVLVDRTKN